MNPSWLVSTRSKFARSPFGELVAAQFAVLVAVPEAEPFGGLRRPFAVGRLDRVLGGNGPEQNQGHCGGGYNQLIASHGEVSRGPRKGNGLSLDQVERQVKPASLLYNPNRSVSSTDAAKHGRFRRHPRGKLVHEQHTARQVRLRELDQVPVVGEEEHLGVLR